ncbi:MAG: hypothetical protein LBL01_02680 [Bifidobacteriaceae bacterium]|jgi:hypothetical protein|nr:hypothetical protein [Bifidobacteriaceae bacterium]
MNAEPRVALQRLVAALERHLDAVAASRGEDGPGLQAAHKQLTEAFQAYEEALFDSYGAYTPFMVYDEDEDDLLDEEFDLEDLEDLDSPEEETF